MLPQDLVRSLALSIRDAVRPHMGEFQARRNTGTAVSGDTTFAIDDVAEEAIVEFIKRHDLTVAYYSEDKGLVEFGDNPDGVLIIDPIDGTRPAMAGFEQCVVSVAWADYVPNVTLGDVRYGCIAELKQNDVFVAERGHGITWYGHDGQVKAPRLLPVTEIRYAPLSFEVAGRPMEHVASVMSEIVDGASLPAGAFMYSSTAFSLIRLVTGQLAAAIDVGNRIYADAPATREAFQKLGSGKMIGLFTYDLAAAALIAQEAGATVTDAYGKSIWDTPLLDTSQSNLKTICATSTPELHSAMMASIERGMTRLHARLESDTTCS